MTIKELTMLYQQQFVYVNCFHFFTIYETKDFNFFNQFQVYTAQQVKYSGGVFFKNKNDKHTRTQRLSSFHQFLHRTKTSFVSYQ